MHNNEPLEYFLIAIFVVSAFVKVKTNEIIHAFYLFTFVMCIQQLWKGFEKRKYSNETRCIAFSKKKSFEKTTV